MRTCENCEIRKQYAKCFDSHFDWRDCPYACEYAKERVKEELTSAQPEIIRCKECKWWIERHPRLGVPWCRQMHLDRNADGYCEMGERSEDAAN